MGTAAAAKIVPFAAVAAAAAGLIVAAVALALGVDALFWLLQLLYRRCNHDS